MKSIKSKLYVGNLLPKEKMMNILGGAWQFTCFGASTMDRLDRDTGEPGCGDFEHSTVNTTSDHSWANYVISSPSTLLVNLKSK